MELLEALRRSMRLEYISDLRRARIDAAWVLSAFIPPADGYPAGEWDEAVRYLAGRRLSAAERNRAAVLGLLILKTEGGDETWRPSP